MQKVAEVVGALIMVVWSFAASAATLTVYTDRSLYDAAVAGQPLTVGSVPLDPLAPFFVNPPELNIHSSSGSNPVFVVTAGPDVFLTNLNNGTIPTLDMAPSSNVRAIGFDFYVGDPAPFPFFTGTQNSNVYVDGFLEESVSYVPAFSTLRLVSFFGVVSDGAISSVVLKSFGTGNYLTDQSEFMKGITFATVSTAVTPIPAALPLFASALAGLGFMKWRRRRRSDAS